MQLRDYQLEMLEACQKFILEDKGNGIIAAVGGVGKSLTMNALFKWLVETYPTVRVMQLCHDAKIIRQNMESMRRFWKDAPIGCYSAGLDQRDTNKHILYCGIQSVSNKAHLFEAPHVIVIDEAHMVSDKENTRYQKFLANYPDARVIAFTATAYRLGVGCMTFMDLWDKIILDLTKRDRFNKFVSDGYLAPLVNKRACVEIDITDISMRGGDFNEKEMNEAADKDEIHQAVVSECMKYGADRKKWMIFSAGIKNGHTLAKLLNAKGIPTVMLTGEDSMEYRKEQEEKYHNGELRCMVNVGLYGTGYDEPEIDLIAVVRATQSTGWWVQALLRGTRPFPNKENCLVLDFAGNTKRLGAVNDPVIPKPRRKGDAAGGEAPIKECPECHSYVPIQVRECPDCGYKFPPPKTIQKTAATDAIMVSSDPQIEEFEVRGVKYQPKVSKAGNPYLSISYNVLTQQFREVLFFPNKKNEKWWLHRGGELPIPESVDEAADRAGKELKIPTLIRVDVNKKYPEVCGVEMEKELPEFDPRKCKCNHPNAVVPCSYCESGEYKPM